VEALKVELGEEGFVVKFFFVFSIPLELE